MEIRELEQKLREEVCSMLSLSQDSRGRIHLNTPFQFNDGDIFRVVLLQRETDWLLTDEGNTLMHLSYEIDTDDVKKGNRATIIKNATGMFGLQDINGILQMSTNQDRIGTSFYSFLQALIHISDVTYLSRDRVASTFLEDLKEFITEIVPEDKLVKKWHNPDRDPGGLYITDYRIAGTEKPVHIFAVPNDSKARDATISLLQYESWDLHYSSAAVFENQEEISRKVLARLSDVCGKQFSSLDMNRPRIKDYLLEA